MNRQKRAKTSNLGPNTNRKRNGARKTVVLDKKVASTASTESRNSTVKPALQDHPVMSTLKETIQSGSRKLGDALERVGQTLQRKGYNKIGADLERIGNKVEHSADRL